MDIPDSEPTTLIADTHQQHDFPLKRDRPGNEKGRREPVEHEMFESEPEDGHTFVRTKPELESGQDEKNSLGAPHPSSEPHKETEEDYLFGKQLESNTPPKGDNSLPESLSEVKSESHETHSQSHNDKGEDHLFETKSASKESPETLVPEEKTRDACQNTDSENFDSDQGESSAEDEEDYVLEDAAHPSFVPHERHSFRYNEGFDTRGASAKVCARSVPRSRPGLFRTRSETSMGTTKRTTPNNSNRSIYYLDDDSESEASLSSGYSGKKSASFGASKRRSRSRSSSRINTNSVKRRAPRKRSSLNLLNSDSSSSEDESQAENGMCTIEENRQCHRFPNRFKRCQALKAVVSRVPKDNPDDQELSSLVTADRHRKAERHTRNDANVSTDSNVQLLQSNDHLVLPNSQIPITPSGTGLHCPEDYSLASPSEQEHASSTHSNEICSNLEQACAGETGVHESRRQKMRVDKSQKLSSRQSKPESVKELGSVVEGQASGWPNGDIKNDTENKSEDLAMNENLVETAAVKQYYPDDPSLLTPNVNHPRALSQTDTFGLEPAQTNTAGCNANAGSGESTQAVSFSLFETPRRSQTPVPHPLPISRLDDDDTGGELQQQDRPPPQTSADESTASAVPDAVVSNERPDTQQSPAFNQQGNSTSLQIADTVHLTPGFNQRGNSTSLQIADTVHLTPVFNQRGNSTSLQIADTVHLTPVFNQRGNSTSLQIADTVHLTPGFNQRGNSTSLQIADTVHLTPGFNQRGNSTSLQIADTVHLTPVFNQRGNSTSLQIADTVRLRPQRIRGMRGRDFLIPRILGACAPDVCTTATVVDLKGWYVDMRCLQDRHRVGRTREIRWVERLHYIDDHQVHEDASDIEQLRRLFRSRHTEQELGLCLLCSIQQADCVLLNCQHCVVCVYCARGLAGCPVCDREVLRFIRIY